jgi:hypothetical protein
MKAGESQQSRGRRWRSFPVYGFGGSDLPTRVIRDGGLRTATPAINRGKCWYSAAFSEFTPLFLNGVQRSVNRKVQGSNPWSGAKS